MNGKPGDRPLPDGSGNWNADGTERDLDAENPSQADRMKLPYPEDMPADKEADVTDASGAVTDELPTAGPGSLPDHGHSGDAPGHTGDPNPGHGGTPPGQVGGGGSAPGNSGNAPGHAGGSSPGKSGEAPGHNK